MQTTLGTNNPLKTYNTAHAFAPGDHVIAGGRPATVKSVCPTGAVNVLTAGGALMTFIDAVRPVNEKAVTA